VVRAGVPEAEVAEMILRIGDVISAGKLEKGVSGKMPKAPPGEAEY
jgi:hypothetical protein